MEVIDHSNMFIFSDKARGKQIVVCTYLIIKCAAFITSSTFFVDVLLTLSYFFEKHWMYITVDTAEQSKYILVNYRD